MASNRRVLTAIYCGFTFMRGLAIGSVGPLLPQMRSNLGCDAADQECDLGPVMIAWGMGGIPVCFIAMQSKAWFDEGHSALVSAGVAAGCALLGLAAPPRGRARGFNTL